MADPDVVVVGAGPNGLAAAVTMARAGLAVAVYERAASAGGGARTLELTLPGFRHDFGAAVHPMAFASPFFRAFELDRRVEFALPEISYVHPLADGRAGVAFRDLEATVSHLGTDGPRWRGLFAPLVRYTDAVTEFSSGPLLRVPPNPIVALRVGLRTLEQGSPLWNLRFGEETAPAMLTGVMAHGIGRMPALPAAGVGLVLASHAHSRGWPVPIGGTQSIIDALLADLLAHGGTIEYGRDVTDLDELPRSRVTMLDVSARAMASIGAARLPDAYLTALRKFRYGDGVAKVDFALSAPVPWSNEFARRAGTLHLGGTREEIAASEAVVARGGMPDNPYVLGSQPSLFDATRAPEGRHTFWAYTHVPAGSTVDPTEAITAQIERSAPGFRDTILASASMSAAELGRLDPNLIGGDISSGVLDLRQLIARPTFSGTPWRTPTRGLYLCSSSTVPGTGVHGLSGFYAARTALRDEFMIRETPPLGV